MLISLRRSFEADEPFPAGCGVGDSANDVCLSEWNAFSATLAIPASIMKQDYPNIPVAINHNPYEMLQRLRNVRSTIFNPDYVDWHSFDCYDDFNYCGLGEYGHFSIPQWLDVLKAALRPGQRLFLIPQAYSPLDDTYYATASESVLITRAHQYTDLAESEPLVIGMFPFKWAFDSPATRDMPALGSEWRQIARGITGRGFAWQFPVIGDFNADGKDDVAWHNR